MGGSEAEQVALTSPLTRVRKRARFASFNASPEPIRKGRKLAVRGTLLNSYNSDPLGDRQVTIWFRPKTSKAWRKLAVAVTGSQGGFSKAITAAYDGYWRATYAGDAVYFGSTSAGDYVDVR